MAICEKCIKQSVCKLCDGTEIMGCIEFVSVDCISRTRAIERLKLNFPISQGADNSRDRHRYMQALADLQAIKELPSVTPQEPKSEWEHDHEILKAYSDGAKIDTMRKYQQLQADYEARLKADMVAILEDLRLDFQEAELAGVLDNKELIFADEADYLIQQKINALKEREDGTENADQGYKS